ncbi:hypothetical protein CPC08DRAFT_722327 [Agrocybe pediades]|nr:hypothetical protein CPC08DRAFT_722327 [Agrocybe pediades]
MPVLKDIVKGKSVQQMSGNSRTSERACLTFGLQQEAKTGLKAGGYESVEETSQRKEGDCAVFKERFEFRVNAEIGPNEERARRWLMGCSFGSQKSLKNPSLRIIHVLGRADSYRMVTSAWSADMNYAGETTQKGPFWLNNGIDDPHGHNKLLRFFVCYSSRQQFHRLARNFYWRNSRTKPDQHDQIDRQFGGIPTFQFNIPSRHKTHEAPHRGDKQGGPPRHNDKPGQKLEDGAGRCGGRWSGQGDVKVVHHLQITRFLATIIEYPLDSPFGYIASTICANSEGLRKEDFQPSTTQL